MAREWRFSSAHEPRADRGSPCTSLRYRLSLSLEEAMTYKLDGAKFASIEELIEALYPIYADRMSEEEFRKYVEEHAEKQ
jgi:hypothetical protein